MRIGRYRQQKLEITVKYEDGNEYDKYAAAVMIRPSRHAIFREYLLCVPSVLQCSGHPGNI